MTIIYFNSVSGSVKSAQQIVEISDTVASEV